MAKPSHTAHMGCGKVGRLFCGRSPEREGSLMSGTGVLKALLSKGITAHGFVPAPHEGSTIGISKVNGYSDMQDGFALCAKYDDVVLAEEFIQGRELTVAILGAGSSARALPVIEIRAPGGNYDYEHKYLSDDTQY